MLTRAQCVDLDARDPLAGLRDRFDLPSGVVYLDGNSLGAMPRSVPERIHATVMHEWRTDLITSWNRHGWIGLPTAVGAKIATLVGAPPSSIMVSDSTSINLFKVASAALDMTERPVILTDSGNFPTDRYVLDGLAETRRRTLKAVPPTEIIDHLDETVGVVALTEVDYRTGRRHDMASLTAAAHAEGALIIWDLAHSTGAFPVELEKADADFAVGCGYKYLNGGPGAPAFAYVAERHIAGFRNPIAGWFGHARPFEFSPEFTPAAGLDRLRVGTPPVLSLVALDAALDAFAGVDLSEIRAKSERLTGLFMDLIEDGLEGFGLEIITPRASADRGSQVSLRHAEAYPIVQALIAENVIGDFRAPDVARFGFAPLYVRYCDVWDAVDALARVIRTELWRDPRFSERNRVT
ncbi:MAG: kynureninase [Acidimicrobiia bacterium]|nr:kynureninase [Acidimicrobiia bacterium]